MSWLRSTLTKGRESLEAVKSAGAKVTSAAAQSTQAIASNAVTKARRLAKGRASVVELEAQLEKKARETKTAVGIQAMHKDWLQQIATKEGKSSPDGERELSFKEMLLQSRAIELSIEVIAGDPGLREQYSTPPAAEDKASPVATLYELLSKTLSCPLSHWSEALRLALGGEGPLSDDNISWVVGIVSAVKLDWHEEALYAERKELALRAEFLRQEVKGLEAAEKADDEKCKRRVTASSELLQTYQAVRRNLEEAQSHRQEVFQEREKDLGLIGEQVQAHIVGLQSTASASTSKHKDLEAELKQSQTSIQSQLQHMDEVRVEIDKELEQLEEKKKQLRIELDNVSRELDEARLKQKQHMDKCDKQRSELAGVKTGFKDKIEAEDAAIKEAEREQGVVEQTQQLVKDTDALAQSTLGTQLDDIKKKQALFQEQFQELLKDHLRHSEEQLKHLRTRAEAATSGEDQAELGAVATAASEAADAFGRFRTEHLEALAGSPEEATVEHLEAEFRAVLQLVPAPAAAEPTAAGAPAFSPPPRKQTGTEAPGAPLLGEASEAAAEPAAQPAAALATAVAAEPATSPAAEPAAAAAAEPAAAAAAESAARAAAQPAAEAAAEAAAGDATGQASADAPPEPARALV